MSEEKSWSMKNFSLLRGEEKVFASNNLKGLKYSERSFCCARAELKVYSCSEEYAYERLNDSASRVRERKTLRQDQRHFIVMHRCLAVDWKASTRWNLDERCLIASINPKVILLNALNEECSRSVIDTFYAQQFPSMLARGISPFTHFQQSDSKSKCWFETFSGWRAPSRMKMNQFNRFFATAEMLEGSDGEEDENILVKSFSIDFPFLSLSPVMNKKKNFSRWKCFDRSLEISSKTFAFRERIPIWLQKLCLKLE